MLFSSLMEFQPKAAFPRGFKTHTIKDWPKWLFYTWVDHGKGPVCFILWSFTMANPGVKKSHFGSFYPAKECDLE